MDAQRAAAVEILVVSDTVVLKLEPVGDGPALVAVMTPREAHHLRSRLHKGANDAGAAAARKAA